MGKEGRGEGKEVGGEWKEKGKRGEVKGRRRGGEGKEGGEKRGREKGEEEKRGCKLGKVKTIFVGKQCLSFSTCQGWWSSPTTGRRGKREGEIGSISKGHTSFSKTFFWY